MYESQCDITRRDCYRRHAPIRYPDDDVLPPLDQVKAAGEPERPGPAADDRQEGSRVPLWAEILFPTGGATVLGLAGYVAGLEIAGWTLDSPRTWVVLVGFFFGSLAHAMVRRNIHHTGWQAQYAVTLIGAAVLSAGVFLGGYYAIKATFAKESVMVRPPVSASGPVAANLPVSLLPGTLLAFGGHVYAIDTSGFLRVLIRDGDGWAMPTRGQARFPAAVDLVGCGKSLVVSYGAGEMAKMRPADGRVVDRLGPDRFSQDLLLACGASAASTGEDERSPTARPSLWAAQDQPTEHEPGHVVRFDPKTFEAISDYLLFAEDFHVDELLAHGAWVFAADSERHVVHGIDENTVVDSTPYSPMVDGIEGDALANVDGRLFALGEDGCLEQASVPDEKTVGVPIPVATGPALLFQSDETLFSIDRQGGHLFSVDATRPDTASYHGQVAHRPRGAVTNGEQLVISDQDQAVYVYDFDEVDAARGDDRPKLSTC